MIVIQYEELRVCVQLLCEERHSTFCNDQNSNQIYLVYNVIIKTKSKAIFTIVIKLMATNMSDILCYHVTIGAVRDCCLTNYSEDHCHEDYGNGLAHLVRVMMKMMV